MGNAWQTRDDRNKGASGRSSSTANERGRSVRSDSVNEYFKRREVEPPGARLFVIMNHMREISRNIVGIIIFSKDGKILLVKSNPVNKGAYEGYWVIHGGGIEEGETKEQAVIRETLEETGIDISNYALELVSDSRTGQSEKNLKPSGERVMVNMKFFEYKVEMSDLNAADIKVTLSHEHSDFKWVKPEELSSMKLSPPTFGLFKELGYIKSH